MSDTPWLLTDQPAPNVTRITLNRPEQFNPLSRDMLSALQQTLDAVAADRTCRVVLLAATGKAFSAGHDLREMRSNPDEAFYRALFAQCSAMMLTIQRMPQPVIALVQGIATAAGCQLVAMCDLALATAHARFAVSGINYGLFCSTPSVGVSRAMGRKQAMEMLLTGDFIDADEAQRRGLINRVVDEQALDTEALALAQKIAAKPAVAVAMGKSLFYRQLEAPIAQAYQDAEATMACNMMDEYAQEGFLAFLEKRQPQFNP
ncbi:MAG: enoyl-CoA hydratase [Proteobacteria bacterium]|nr:enoyl-CoA hydratase [Pseudomonadota bacterium]